MHVELCWDKEGLFTVEILISRGIACRGNAIGMFAMQYSLARLYSIDASDNMLQTVNMYYYQNRDRPAV